MKFTIEARCQTEPERGYIYNFWDVVYVDDRGERILKEDLTVSQVTDFMNKLKDHIEKL